MSDPLDTDWIKPGAKAIVEIEGEAGSYAFVQLRSAVGWHTIAHVSALSPLPAPAASAIAEADAAIVRASLAWREHNADHGQTWGNFPHTQAWVAAIDARRALDQPADPVREAAASLRNFLTHGPLLAPGDRERLFKVLKAIEPEAVERNREVGP